MAAQDAEDLGVQTGDTVEVASSEHAGQVEARVTQRLKPGVVFLPTHYGGDSPYQTRAYQLRHQRSRISSRSTWSRASAP